MPSPVDVQHLAKKFHVAGQDGELTYTVYQPFAVERGWSSRAINCFQPCSRKSGLDTKRCHFLIVAATAAQPFHDEHFQTPG